MTVARLQAQDHLILSYLDTLDDFSHQVRQRLPVQPGRVIRCGVLVQCHCIGRIRGTHAAYDDILKNECRNAGATLGQDLVVFAPSFALTSFNNIVTTAGSQFFNYNSNTRVLTVNGTGGDDQFSFTQATSQSASGALSTTYYITIGGETQSFTSGQVATIVFNGNGGNDTAVLVTSDSYTGTDGRIHDARGRISPRGATVRSAATTAANLMK